MGWKVASGDVGDVIEDVTFYIQVHHINLILPALLCYHVLLYNHRCGFFERHVTSFLSYWLAFCLIEPVVVRSGRLLLL